MIVGLQGSSAAALEIEHWGLWADGTDERDALTRLVGEAHERFARFLAVHGATCAPAGDAIVAERQPSHDEDAFDFERLPATSAERERTLELYGWARADLLRLLEDATDDELDWVDPARCLPSWAWWHTARQMAWHCAITESCYYLGRVGVPRPEPFSELARPLPAPDTQTLLELLAVSSDHVHQWIECLEPDIEVVAADEVWTTRKVLRRLAGHERAENEVTADLLRSARSALLD